MDHDEDESEWPMKKKCWMLLALWMGVVAASRGAAPVAGFGTALEFDGTDDHVALPASLTGAVGGGNAITIEYWFKGTELQSPVRFQVGGGYLVAGWGSSSPKHIVSTDGGTGGGISCGDESVIEDGHWHHLAMVWQRNTANGFRGYLDGELVAQRNSADVALPSLSGATPYLGCKYGTSEFAAGKLDEVRIWDTALSANVLTNWICREVDATHPAHSNLVAYYKLDDGTGTNTVDAAGPYDGILRNMDGTEWVGSGAGRDWVVDEAASNTACLVGSDADGSSGNGTDWTLSFEIVDPPTNGTAAVLHDNVFSYHVDADIADTESFTYRVRDAGGLVSSKRTVQLSITALPAAVDITNANTTAYGEDATYTLVGTNNEYTVGSMEWANAANGADGIFPVSGLQFQASGIPLEFGENVLTVLGTNRQGRTASDSVTVRREREHGGDSPIHYVATNGAAVWPYTNWVQAARRIQDAVDAAASNDTVLVGSGTYATGGGGGNRVRIERPCTLRGVDGPQNTFIDGGDTVRCLHLVAACTVEGLTLVNGAVHSWPKDGGGIYLGPGSVVSNCTVTGCAVGGSGGGVFLNGGGTLRNCLIEDNWAWANAPYHSGGGGVALDGGGLVENCTITGNRAVQPDGSLGYGGGALIRDGGTVRSCLITGNSARRAGGGVHIYTRYGGAPDMEIHCCTVSDNSADRDGGGGISLVSEYPDPRVDARNTIVYYNTAPEDADWYHGGYMYGTRCCVPSQPWGSGHITNAPSFVDAANGDYRLLDSSACINAGINGAWMAGARDLDGNPRIDGGVVDIGAYESEVTWHFGDSPLHYVWTNSPSPAWPHTNWTTAAHTVQDAVDAAYVGDTVLVTNGIYGVGGWPATAHPHTNRVCVQRDLAVRSVNGPSHTFIVGATDTETNGLAAVRGAYLTGNALLSGFTLMGGHCATNGGGVLFDGGGYMSHCIVHDCGTAANGGGVAFHAGGTIDYCSIVHNTAGQSGGGVYGDGGGGVSNSIVWGNTAADWGPNWRNNGGGMHYAYSCTAPAAHLPGGIGCFDDNPRFADPEAGDFHLKSESGRWQPTGDQWTNDAVSSRCIDGANPGDVYANEPAINGARANLGAYGNTAEASKSGRPTVLTSNVTDITHVAATCGGTVVAPGASAVTARGCVWNTTGSPTIADSRTIDGADTGSFTSRLTNLTPGTVYHVRSYAGNAHGTGYGETRRFTAVGHPTAGLGMALDFDGVDEYVRISDRGALDLATDYTLECWFRADALGGTRVLASKGDSYSLLLDDSTLRFDGMTAAGLTIQTGVWVHAAAVNDGGVRRLYVDGQAMSLDGTPSVGPANGDPLLLAGGPAGQWLDGRMDEVRVWHAALPANVVSNWMHRQVDHTHPLRGSLAACYRFNEGSGNTSADLVGGEDAELVGSGGGGWVASGVGREFVIIEDVPTTAYLAGSDEWGTSSNGTDWILAFEMVDPPTHGSVTMLTANAFSYHVDRAVAVEDSFTYRVHGASGFTSALVTAEIEIVIGEPNVEITPSTLYPGEEHATFALDGTAVSIVGTMWWTNAANGANGQWAAPGSGVTRWEIAVPLEFGNNQISVFGTNYIGDLGSDTVTLRRGHWDGGNMPFHYVSLDSSSPTWPYTNWATAAHTIQEAVDAAKPGDTVLVTNGVYNAGDSGGNRVRITEPVAVRSVNGREETFIAGGSDIRCVHLDVAGAVLSGFTLTNGVVTGSHGGGAWLDPGTILSNCTVAGNSSTRGGGGVCCNRGGTVEDCTLSGNTCRESGGGAYCNYGGTVRTCLIQGNLAEGNAPYSAGGGGVALTEGSLVEGCMIVSNSAAQIGGTLGYGGGVYIQDGGTVRSCLITGNRAKRVGGGVNTYTSYTETPNAVHNCTVSGNSADSAGGGISHYTEHGNSAVDVRNTIVYYNTAPQDPDWYDGGDMDCNYCCLPIDPGGAGNLTSPPLFVDASNGNYRLQMKSFCINAGEDGDWMAGAEALDGHPRIDGRRVDIGAYEYDESWWALGDTPAHYVWTSSPSPAWPYTNWATAAHTIQDAVFAATSNDTVWVTNGVYEAGEWGRNRVRVWRAMLVRSVNGPEHTAIVGGLNLRCVHMVVSGASLGGFTLADGVVYRPRYGGGVHLVPGSVVSNCVITNCSARDTGGGGGAFCDGGGTLVHCTFSGNDGRHGGGVRCYYGGTLVNCVFTGNLGHFGGGVYCHKGGALANCILTGNSGALGGGAYFDEGGRLVNCTLSGNDAEYYGGGAFCYEGGTLDNCIAWGNSAITGQDLDMAHSTIRHTCASDGITHGVDGCITNNPMFVAAAGGNFRLKSGSPCIDTGLDAYAPAFRDPDGHPRILDGDLDGIHAIDMGAYEFEPRAFVDITDPAEAITVPGETLAWDIAGTNNEWAVGAVRWANPAAGAGGEWQVASSDWAVTNIPLVPRANVITVTATNRLGDIASDSVTITREILHRGDSPVHYVATNGLAVWPYTNWTDAAATIQDAVDAASDGDTVLVGDGTYAAGGAGSRATLKRAIALQSANGPEHTVIKGGSDMRCVYLNASGSSLSGFTLSNGAVEGSGVGGGLYLKTGTVASNCTVTACSAGNDGGGVFFNGGGEGHALNICSNTCGDAGGGVYFWNGGTLSNSTVEANKSGGSGGGLLMRVGALVENCAIRGNHAGDGTTEDGGGIWFYSGGTARGCLIVGNSAQDDGGGAYFSAGASNAVLESCTVVSNTGEYGGGVRTWGGTVRNCIIYENTCAVSGTNWSWGGNSPAIEYTCTAPTNGIPGGMGCITNDPLFVGGGDPPSPGGYGATGYHLRSASPCVNAGSNQDWMSGGTDLDGSPRINTATVDMGAYETTGDAPSPESDVLCYMNVSVVQNDTNNTPASVTLSTSEVHGDIAVAAARANRGDYGIQVGADPADDPTNGVLIACVGENGRDNGEEAPLDGVRYATATAFDVASWNYTIGLHDAPSGSEYNQNVAAAYFPFEGGWKCGHALNSVNNGPITVLRSSPGLALEDAFIDNTNGTYTLAIPGVDGRTDGVLLVCGGRNEDNFALSKVNANGSWTIYCHDNGVNGDSHETDPVAFAYVPTGLTGVVVGRFDAEGDAILGGGFSVTHTGTGTFELSIPGRAPDTGVLIVSPEGGESHNQDNIVTYQASGSGWTIQTRDLSDSATTPALEDLAADQPVCSFAFFPSPMAGAGNALKFDGTNDYVTLGADASLALTNGAFTIEAWISPAEKTSICTILGRKNGGGSNPGYAFYANSWSTADRRLVFETQGTVIKTVAPVITWDQWQHVAATWDGAALRFYVNGGEQATTGTVNLVDGGVAATLGAFSTANLLYRGTLDEVRAWTVTRSEAELRDGMHRTLNGDEAGLVAYYRCDHSSSDTVLDLTASHHDGTLVNGPVWVAGDFPCADAIAGKANIRGVWDGLRTSHASSRLSVSNAGVAGVDFALAGHDNGTNDWQDADCPAGIGRRLARIWQLEVSGSVDDDLVIDTTGLTGLGNGSGLRLLRDSDGVFANGDALAGTYTAGRLTVVGQTLSNGTHYTLGVLPPCTITATAGTRGAIEPSGVVNVPYGGETNFTMLPDTYWHVADVATNGASVGAVTGFAWSNITANGTIHVTFAPYLAVGGTPHWWLAQHGWSNDFDQAETDNPDGDPHDNRQEFIAQTDPTDATDYFRIVDISNNSPATLYFESSSNRRYTMEGNSNLVSGAWANVPGGGPRSGTGGADAMQDTNAPPKGPYYRLQVELP